MHCVNRNIPEFKLLTDQSGLSEEALAAKVSVWQDRHNTDAIPSMVELYNSPNQGIKYQLPKQQSDAIDNVFDENPELANEVYDALGFNNKLNIPNYITTSRPYSDENIGSKGRTGNMVEFTSSDNIDEYRQNMGGYLIQTNDEGRLYITDIEKFSEDSTFKGLGTVAYVDFYENYKHKSQGLTTDKSLTSDGIRVLERLEKIGLVYKTDAVLIDDTQKHRRLNTTLYKYNKPLYEFNFNWSRTQITPQQKQQAKEVYQQYLDSELGSKQDIQQVKEFISSRNNQGNNQSLQEGLNWLESVNPNVQPEIVQGLIDGIANGSYNSNLDLITLSEEFANKKTVKHEFLHSVASRLFATQEHYVLDKMIKKGEIEENCTGKLKAKEGLQFNFKHGGEWKIIKDLKGYPTHEKGGVDLTIGKNGVSIKNGDTQFTAKHGLVISAIKAQEGLVETLPVASQYAGDGSLLPDWDKVKTTLNPYNWGVTDYSDKGDFNTAYSTARKSGEKEFLFNGKRYNTNYKGTPQQQLKETGLTNEQIQDRSKLNKNLTENIYPYSYNNLEKRIWKAGVLGKKEENREAIDKDPRPYDKEKLDALNLYAGVPQKNNTFRISNYKPSISKDNINYYTFNKQDDKFVQNLIDYAYLKSKGSTDGSAKGYDVGVKGLVPDQEKNVMGNYKMSTGKDDRGAYVSFYDEWDLAPMDFGKPFEIYDRIYTKDYGDGTQKRMYYTDKELSELNIDKKDFDTLGLQRELSNRGYKLPKSTKQDGSFDGIWGDETKNALLEYRKSQNKSKQ